MITTILPSWCDHLVKLLLPISIYIYRFFDHYWTVLPRRNSSSLCNLLLHFYVGLVEFMQLLIVALDLFTDRLHSTLKGWWWLRLSVNVMIIIFWLWIFSSLLLLLCFLCKVLLDPRRNLNNLTSSFLWLFSSKIRHNNSSCNYRRWILYFWTELTNLLLLLAYLAQKIIEWWRRSRCSKTITTNITTILLLILISILIRSNYISIYCMLSILLSLSSTILFLSLITLYFILLNLLNIPILLILILIIIFIFK